MGGKSDAEPSIARQILPPTRECPAAIPSMPRGAGALARDRCPVKVAGKMEKCSTWNILSILI